METVESDIVSHAIKGTGDSFEAGHIDNEGRDDATEGEDDKGLDEGNDCGGDETDADDDDKDPPGQRPFGRWQRRQHGLHGLADSADGANCAESRDMQPRGVSDGLDQPLTAMNQTE